MNREANPVEVKEVSVLEKFEGEPLPANLIERIHVVDGKIIKVDKYKDGKLIESKTVKEVT